MCTTVYVHNIINDKFCTYPMAINAIDRICVIRLVAEA